MFLCVSGKGRGRGGKPFKLHEMTHKKEGKWKRGEGEGETDDGFRRQTRREEEGKKFFSFLFSATAALAYSLATLSSLETAPFFWRQILLFPHRRQRQLKNGIPRFYLAQQSVGTVPQLLASFAPTTEMPYEKWPPSPPSPHASAHGKQQPAFVPHRNKAAAATVVGFPLLFRQLHDRIHIYCRLFKGGREGSKLSPGRKSNRGCGRRERDGGREAQKVGAKCGLWRPPRRSLQPARKEGECIINGFALSRSTDGGRTDLRADMNHLDVRQQLRPTDRPERVFLSANSEQQRMGIQRIRGGCCSLSRCCRSARC